MPQSKPFRFQIVEIDNDVFNMPRSEFESFINLELAIAQKEQREYLMDEYLSRNGETPPDPDLTEPVQWS